MKTKITVLFLSVVISACAAVPTTLNSANGKQRFTMDCNSGIEKCHQKSVELCPDGYDIIDHTKKTSTLLPHYGQYPKVIHIESLTVECR
tara:strand:- start:2207 stop:2476 length:270 start_codon:yes stop_codon:yes gene_type:complete